MTCQIGHSSIFATSVQYGVERCSAGDAVNPTLLLSDNDDISWNDGSQLLDAGRREYGRLFEHRPYVKYASDGSLRAMLAPSILETTLRLEPA